MHMYHSTSLFFHVQLVFFFFTPSEREKTRRNIQERKKEGEGTIREKRRKEGEEEYSC